MYVAGGGVAVRRARSAAAAIESNLVNNAYGYQSQSGRWVDQSNRTGYGLTMSWNTLKSDPQDGAVVNLSTALLDAADETDFSAGINALWHRVELGYIYAHNKIDQFNMAGVSGECDDDCAILAPGRYDIHTLHTSAVAEYYGDAELQYLPWRLRLVARFHGGEEREFR